MEKAYRTCNKCLVEKDISSFYRNKSGGVHYRMLSCKECHKKRVTEKNKRNKPQVVIELSEIKKTCYTCSIEKFEHDFYKCDSNKEGLDRTCKVCRRAMQANRRSLISKGSYVSTRGKLKGVNRYKGCEIKTGVHFINFLNTGYERIINNTSINPSYINVHEF